MPSVMLLFSSLASSAGCSEKENASRQRTSVSAAQQRALRCSTLLRALFHMPDSMEPG
jgi:hypothetical protein